MLVPKYMDHNGLAVMPSAKKLASVALKMSLKNPICAGNEE